MTARDRGFVVQVGSASGVARAVVYAVDHARCRAYWAGGSRVGTTVGTRVAGGLLDRYRARTGVVSQQTDEPPAPERPEKLWEPADGEVGRDFGAHGEFDDRAHSRSRQMWLSQHPFRGGVGRPGRVGRPGIRSGCCCPGCAPPTRPPPCSPTGSRATQIHQLDSGGREGVPLAQLLASGYRDRVPPTHERCST